MWFYYQKSVAGTFESGIHDDCVLTSAAVQQYNLKFFFCMDLTLSKISALLSHLKLISKQLVC